MINPDVQQRFLGIWSGSGPDGLLADCCFLVACTSVENRVLLFLNHKLSKRHISSVVGMRVLKRRVSNYVVRTC